MAEKYRFSRVQQQLRRQHPNFAGSHTPRQPAGRMFGESKRTGNSLIQCGFGSEIRIPTGGKNDLTL